MKYLLSATLCMLAFNLSFAQQGEATYFMRISTGISFSPNNKISKQEQDKILEAAMKRNQKEYTLVFTTKESVYKQNAQLDTPAKSNRFPTSYSPGDVLYKNMTTQTYLYKIDLMGKLFLIKDSLPTTKWTLNSETKTIGNYTCYKATRSYTVDRDEVKIPGRTYDEPNIDTIEVTAWYTPEIPISNGPENYSGLPGLILEVHDDNKIFLCNKITLSNKETIEIKIPKRGKEINQADFDALKTQKLREFVERYSDGKGGLHITK